jgi:hypothetical protein
MHGLEQTVGAIVIFGGLLIAALYAGGFLWYSWVSYPRALRAARRIGIVVVGTNLLGDDQVVEFTESGWRRATFSEWRSVKTYEGERPPMLWPTFRLISPTVDEDSRLS